MKTVDPAMCFWAFDFRILRYLENFSKIRHAYGLPPHLTTIPMIMVIIVMMTKKMMMMMLGLILPVLFKGNWLSDYSSNCLLSIFEGQWLGKKGAAQSCEVDQGERDCLYSL